MKTPAREGKKKQAAAAARKAKTKHPQKKPRVDSLAMTDEKITSLLTAKKWASAEAALKARIKPALDDHLDDHWLWARLNATVYMRDRYKDARVLAGHF